MVIMPRGGTNTKLKIHQPDATTAQYYRIPPEASLFLVGLECLVSCIW